jgi:hypothetical protein
VTRLSFWLAITFSSPTFFYLSTKTMQWKEQRQQDNGQMEMALG